MSGHGARFSREALRARLGDAAFEDAERQAANAPEPTPELVELVRLVFAPTVRAWRPELQHSR
jgi:hypothetical protein